MAKHITIALPEGETFDSNKLSDAAVAGLVKQAAEAAGIKADRLIISSGGSEKSGLVATPKWERSCGGNQ